VDHSVDPLGGRTSGRTVSPRARSVSTKSRPMKPDAPLIAMVATKKEYTLPWT